MLESIVHKRLYVYLENNGILIAWQWGFRPTRSTIDTEADLMESALTVLNPACGVIFVDLQKAFDSIDHAILTDKMYSYGIQSNELVC